MPETTENSAAEQAAQDLAELQFTPIPIDEASEIDDRPYVIGVRSEGVRN